MNLRNGVGQAHAKVILLGEHAVVYGAPAVAVPLPQLTVTARVTQVLDATADPESITVGSADSTPPMTADAIAGLRDLVGQFKTATGVSDSAALQFSMDCAIPPGRGLGSSAACARAVVLALADLYGRKLNAESIFDLIQFAETAAHGKSSGVDAVITGAAGMMSYTAGVARELDCGFNGVFVVADSGASSRTKDAIEHVQRVFAADPGTETDFMHRVRAVTTAGLQCLTDGHRGGFGAMLTENHQLLREIGLSTERIDALVETAVCAGGYGAKISGGGLGGCLVALAGTPTAAQKVAEALREAGAVSTWLVPVGRITDGHS